MSEQLDLFGQGRPLKHCDECGASMEPMQVGGHQRERFRPRSRDGILRCWTCSRQRRRQLQQQSRQAQRTTPVIGVHPLPSCAGCDCEVSPAGNGSYPRLGRDGYYRCPPCRRRHRQALARANYYAARGMTGGLPSCAGCGCEVPRNHDGKLPRPGRDGCHRCPACQADRIRATSRQRMREIAARKAAAPKHCDDCGCPWPSGHRRLPGADGRYRCQSCQAARVDARRIRRLQQEKADRAAARGQVIASGSYRPPPTICEGCGQAPASNQPGSDGRYLCRSCSTARRAARRRARAAANAPAMAAARWDAGPQHCDECHAPLPFGRPRQKSRLDGIFRCPACQAKHRRTMQAGAARARRAASAAPIHCDECGCEVPRYSDGSRPRRNRAGCYLCPDCSAVRKSAAAAAYKARRRRNAVRGRHAAAALVARQYGLCPLCNAPLAGEGMEFDHIRALADGGTDTDDNMQVVHARCHRRKTADEHMARAAATRNRRKGAHYDPEPQTRRHSGDPGHAGEYRAGNHAGAAEEGMRLPQA